MIVRLRYCFSVILFTLCFTLIAQDFSISGKVIDANGSPIEFANVIISAENEEEFFKGTSTDESGNFKLDQLTTATYFIKISFIGYVEFEQKILLNGNLDLKTIQLQEVSESLGEVTVIATKPTITRKPDRLIFNIENTALTQGSTLSVLKSTPGIIVVDGSINIKSATATVYINNRRVELTSNELIQLLESAPANSIKSIEVITNPPASYDADSGSVINIVMSKNLVTGYRGSVYANYTQGVFPRYDAGTSYYFKNKKINFNVNYSYAHQKINRDEDNTINFLDNLDEIEEVWFSDINRNTWYQTHNLNLNFDYYIDDKNTISLTSTGLYMPYFKYKIRNNTNITDNNENFLSRFTADNLSKDNKYNIGTDFIYRHSFDNDASIAVNAHYTIYDYDRNQNVLSNFYDSNNTFENASEFKTIANQQTDIISGKIDYNLPIDEGSELMIGAKYSNVKTESNITRADIINGEEVINTNNSNAFDYNEHVSAGYANYNKSWDNWELVLGIRLEQTNINGFSETLDLTNKQNYLEWFPNASISYQLTDDFSVYGNYKRSIIRPSYTDINPFTFFLNENTVVLGNPNLQPTFTDYVVFGTSFLKHFTFEAYYSIENGAIRELPRQNNETNIIAYTPTNLDKNIDYGFDFSVNFSPTKDWDLYFLTSIYNKKEEIDIDDNFVRVGQWSNYSILSNNISFLRDNSLTLNSTLTWVGKSVISLSTVEERLFSSLSVSKTIFNKKGIISLSIEDLFNFQNETFVINYLNQRTRNFRDVDSRYIKLGFRYNFGNTKLTTNERTTDAEERERLKDLN